MALSTLQKYDCDRCGFSYKKHVLKRQRGMLVCCDCYDNLKRIERPNPRWQSPRDNSTTTTAVNTPNIFSITTSGITSLGWSRDYEQDGTHLHYYMQIEGNGGAIDITSDPQIVAGEYGDVLTLRGNSNTKTVTLDNQEGLKLINGYSMVLTEGDSITLVYQENGVEAAGGGAFGSGAFGSGAFGGSTIPADGWVEVSRNKGGI